MHVTDKADGSLGIIYPTPDGLGRRDPRLVRLGSGAARDGDPAHPVRRRSRRRPASPCSSRSSTRRNRIVVDYGDLDDLMLLGAVDIATGRTYGPDGGADLARAGGRDVRAHARWPRRWRHRRAPNREGLVVWFPTADRAGEDQIRGVRPAAPHRHRSERPCGVGAAGRRQRLADYDEALPDEFHAWVGAVVAHADRDGRRRAAAEVETAYAAIVADAAGRLRAPQGLRAARPARTRCAALLFLRLDDRDYRPLPVAARRPAADWVPRSGAWTNGPNGS